MIENGYFRLPFAGTLLRDADVYRYQKTVKAHNKKLDSKKANPKIQITCIYTTNIVGAFGTS